MLKFRRFNSSKLQTFDGCECFESWDLRHLKLSNLANGKISEASIFEELNLPNGKISKAQILQISRLGKFESRKSKTVEDQHFSIDAANHLNFHLAANKPGCAAPSAIASEAKPEDRYLHLSLSVAAKTTCVASQPTASSSSNLRYIHIYALPHMVVSEGIHVERTAK